jgi:cytochrome P450
VPSLVICELLGVPYADHGFFQSHSGALLRMTAPHEEKIAAFTELMSYMDDLVARKAREPGDDLLSRQLAKTGDRAGAIGLGFLLLIAGHEDDLERYLPRRDDAVGASRGARGDP